MSTSSLAGIAAAAVLVLGLAAGSAQADQPVVKAQAGQPSQPLSGLAAKADAMENALRRSTAAPALAARTYCRDQATRFRLFGIGRHKFLQRCRRARRKARIHPGR